MITERERDDFDTRAFVVLRRRSRVSACVGRSATAFRSSVVLAMTLASFLMLVYRPNGWGACMALSRREVTVTCGRGSQSAPGAPLQSRSCAHDAG